MENKTYYNPIDVVSTTNPPVLLFQGQNDNLVNPEQATNFQLIMNAQGGACIVGMLPSGGHVMDAIYTSLYSQVSLYYIERFLAITSD